ncbi:MAG: DUF2089 family protein [Faecalibacterium sp.]|nr:DUF2089 family protein [Faecalibacterium sp.]
MRTFPLWITELEDDELMFIKRFVTASGSLKEIADVYGVSYPTVRTRLNHIIEKIRLSEETQEDRFESLIKKLAIDGKLDFEAGAILLREYRAKKEER